MCILWAAKGFTVPKLKKIFTSSPVKSNSQYRQANFFDETIENTIFHETTENTV